VLYHDRIYCNNLQSCLVNCGWLPEMVRACYTMVHHIARISYLHVVLTSHKRCFSRLQIVIPIFIICDMPSSLVVQQWGALAFCLYTAIPPWIHLKSLFITGEFSSHVQHKIDRYFWYCRCEVGWTIFFQLLLSPFSMT
jgi:hypothetical protein